MAAAVQNAPWCLDQPHVDFFYRELRDQIKHEDNLCNNRMTWLIAIQAFLFTAYGFSLSAEAVLSTSHATSEVLSDIIQDARTWLAFLGAASALVILAALCAAMLSISKLISKWYEAPLGTRRRYPQIIGNSTKSRPGGALLGQTPLYLVPVASFIVWARISYNPHFQWMVIWTSLGVLVTLVLIFTGVLIERLNAKAREKDERDERSHSVSTP